MQLTKVLMGVNDNPHYTGFWPIVSRFWRERIGIEPVLLKIAAEEAPVRQDRYGKVMTFKAVAGVDTGFQSQVVRLFAPKLFPDDVCLLADVDVLPLNRAYYQQQVHAANKRQIVVYNADAYAPAGREKRYPISYVAGLGSCLQRAFGDWFNFANCVQHLQRLGLGWDTDELFMTRCLDDLPNTSLVLRQRNPTSKGKGWGGVAWRSIDRSDWQYDLELIKKDYYIDAHLPRPAEPELSKLAAHYMDP